MYLHKKRHGRATTRGRDPMRWKVAALIALALLGIGAMHAHVLMFRSGDDVLSALVEAGGMILIAALPVGYLVFRNWFTEHPIGLISADEESFTSAEEGGFMCGAQGCGYYCGSTRIDDDDD